MGRRAMDPKRVARQPERALAFNVLLFKPAPFFREQAFLGFKGGNMTIKCYDFFGCTKPECVMIEKEEEKNCWEVEPALTPCTNMFGDSIRMEDKIVFCENCLFYEHVNKEV